jgi:uncharacterized protein YjbI with pentapeptide repeats
LAHNACQLADCTATAIESEHRCFLHCSEIAREQVLAKVHNGDGLYFTRGLTIDRLILSEILAHAPRSDDGRPRLNRVDFTNAIFLHDATLSGIHFEGQTSFEGAEFAQMADFQGANFLGIASFDHAVFKGQAIFNGAVFEGWIEHMGPVGVYVVHAAGRFSGANFRGDAYFFKVDFKQGVFFDHAIFSGDARFDGSTFAGSAVVTLVGHSHVRGPDVKHGYPNPLRSLGGGDDPYATSFSASALFLDCDFERSMTIGSCSFAAGVVLVGAHIGGDLRMLDSISMRGFELDGAAISGDVTARLWARFDLALNGVSVDGLCAIEANCDIIEARRLRLSQGGILRLHTERPTDLTESHFLGPTTITGQQSIQMMTLEFGRQQWGKRRQSCPIGSLRGAQVAGLTLDEADLSECHFLGAQGLEAVRVQRSCRFASAPKLFLPPAIGKLAQRIAPLRWSVAVVDGLLGRSGRRRVLAEERRWRFDRGEPGWLGPETHGLHDRRPAAQEVEGLYRQLRKSLEDGADTPGAADFYYGEMELRRRGSAPLSGARRLLELYWIISGYGLRAWRPIVSLAALLLLGTLVFSSIGFSQRQVTTYVPVGNKACPSCAPIYEAHSRSSGRPGVEDALVFSSRSLTGFLRAPAPTAPLNIVGECTEIVLRLLGPILLGLTALSVRNNVKR